MKKFFTKMYNKLPNFLKGGLLLWGAAALLGLLIGTVIFLLTPGVTL